MSGDLVRKSLVRGWADGTEVDGAVWWRVCDERGMPFVFVYPPRHRYRRVHVDLLPTARAGRRQLTLTERDANELRDFYLAYAKDLDRAAKRFMLYREGYWFTHTIVDFYILRGDEEKVMPKVMEVVRRAKPGGIEEWGR
ncbi:hypothetical protein Adeg_0875 [Ammonifex degensii KC4]|uniref:Uncharacterized protein n=1 Tax=Ammonifex degensii (strain DSM 10501 / KC4) TaxID=429009 RepID=C9RCN7_AMMDK|nr:hypothetical protein [Ammonifex degensii]ACX52014.1 hypothetical protein Adeg_0875 [Ammonifex degensii KC4]